MGKKILYINFNAIMHPFLSIYLHHIEKDNLSPTDIWEKLNNELNLYEFVQYDPNTLMEIANLLHRFANKKNFKSSISPQDLKSQLSKDDELVYVDFQDSFEDIDCIKTWIYTKHSSISNSSATIYLLNNLSPFFETKHKFDEVYFFFPPDQIPYKFYHLYQLLRKYSIKL